MDFLRKTLKSKNVFIPQSGYRNNNSDNTTTVTTNQKAVIKAGTSPPSFSLVIDILKRELLFYPRKNRITFFCLRPSIQKNPRPEYS